MIIFKFLFKLFYIFGTIIELIIMSSIVINDIIKQGAATFLVKSTTSNYTNIIAEKTRNIFPMRVGIILSFLVWITIINYILFR